MKMLLTQRFAGSPDTGGNRALAAFQSSLTEVLRGQVHVQQIYIGADATPTSDSTPARSLISLFRALPTLASRCSEREFVAFDGLFPMLVFAYGCLTRRQPKYSIVVHHNNEWQLKRPLFRRLFYGTLQKYVARKASVNIFFSTRDLQAISGKPNDLSCLPVRRAEFNALDGYMPGKPHGLPDSYVALPSNLAYPDNVSGLEVFYREFRDFPRRPLPVVISTPTLAPLPKDLCDRMRQCGDRVISFAVADEYRGFLAHAAAVVLPIFSGSGIQLKAIDALLLNQRVFASDFIRAADEAFSSFAPLSTYADVHQQEFLHRARRGVPVFRPVLLDDATRAALSICKQT